MRRAALVGGVVAVVGIGVLAWRLRPVPEEPPLYPDVVAGILARVDTNRDGRVDADEYAAVAMDDDPLSAWDQDGDGTLSPREVERQFLASSPTEQQTKRLEVLKAARSHAPGPDGGDAPPAHDPPGPGSPP